MSRTVCVCVYVCIMTPDPILQTLQGATFTYLLLHYLPGSLENRVMQLIGDSLAETLMQFFNLLLQLLMCQLIASLIAVLVVLFLLRPPRPACRYIE